MFKKIRTQLSSIFVKSLSTLASLALIVTVLAANQRCWFIMHEEKLPGNIHELRKF